MFNAMKQMLITEYRIPLPLTTEEYRIGQLFANMEMSINETGGGEGVEILCNEPTPNLHSLDLNAKGQYTYKIYHMGQKLPSFIRTIASEKPLELHEESWNFFPYCKTEIKKLNLLDDGFSISIQTHHIDDKGDQDNVHNLSEDQLKRRSVIYIDIVNDVMPIKSEYDPTKFKSVKTSRGPFGTNWIETVKPIMTCYKLVMTEFKWFGLQHRVETLIQSTEKSLFFLFNRMVLCSMDKWYGMSIDEIRKMESQYARDLHKKRFEGKVQGMIVKE